MPKKAVKKAAKKAVKSVKKVATSVKSAVTRKKATKSSKRHGDVLGVSSARVPKGTPRATTDRGGNPKGINVRGRTVPSLRPAKVR